MSNPTFGFPPEIFDLIFTMVILLPERTCHIEIPSLVVTQVCRHWRTLAHSIPKFWCHLLINAGQPDVTFLDEQVSRSNDLPLSVRLYAEDEDISEAAITFVLKHQDRIDSLCLDGLHNLFSRFSTRINSKRIKEIHFHSEEWPKKSPIKFGITPQRVRLEAVPFEDIDIKWTEVSSMHIHSVGVNGAMPRLDKVTGLKSLALVLDGWEPQDNGAIVVNNSIEELSLNGSCDAEIVITTMSLPSLKTLDIKIADLTNCSEGLCRFLQGCDLKSIHVRECWEYLHLDDGVATAALIAVLDITRSLQKLTIGPQEVSKRLLPRLLDPNCLTPRLQTLSLSAHFNSDDNPSDFISSCLDVIESRESLDLTLTLTFDQEGHDLPKNIEDRMEAMRAEGKKITIISDVSHDELDDGSDDEESEDELFF